MIRPTGRPQVTGQRVRLADVAAAAGVTKSTASRVLNGDATLSIRPETRARIVDCAAALGYQAHAGARALALDQTRALAIVIPDLTNLTYSRIARGAFQRARVHGYVLLIAEDYADRSADTETALADLVHTHRVDGLMVASARPQDAIVELLRDKHVPHVFVNRTVPGSRRNVSMDAPAASRLAVAHLKELGHRGIGHVAGPAEIVPSLEREHAFHDACQELGVSLHPVSRAPFSPEGGYRAARTLLAKDRTLTSLYVSTYTQAVGVLKAVLDMGYRVPEDISVISFDDLPEAEYVSPPLTTVAMPLVELGAAAVDALVDQLEGRTSTDVLLRTPPRLVRRQSTAPAGPRSTITVGRE